MGPAETAAWTRGAEYLLSNQHADGGWIRSRYGALRGGAALTALACYVLRRGTPELRVAAQKPLAAAVAFLRRGLARRGTIAAPDGTLDMPVYATSLALLADQGEPAMWRPDERVRMLRFLLDSQVAPARGFAADDPQTGGWDLGTVPPPRAITTGTNVSLTSWALAALAVAKSSWEKNVLSQAVLNPSSDASTETLELSIERAQKLALDWLKRCQNTPGDGGFTFTVVPHSTDNKAGIEAGTGRGLSYASATCDGWVALRAVGVARDADARVAARRWLEKHIRIAPSNTADWSQALWFYFAARAAEVESEWEGEPSEMARQQRVQEILSRQRADGSWFNPVPQMREDDPLIATPLAMLALALGVSESAK